MSFEIKYDKNGNVITPPPVVEEQPEQVTPNPMLAPVQEPQDWPTEPEGEDVVEELPEPAQAAPAPKPNSAEMNWRRLEAEKLRLEEEVRALREAQSRQQQPQQPEEDYSVNLNDDDLAEGRHLTKVQKEVRNLKKELANYQAQMQQMTLEARIKAQYPDFDQVVSQQNVAALNQAEPELAQSIGANRDLYSQAVSAYKAIKRLGIAGEPVDPQQLERVKKNTAKPRTAASVMGGSESPLARAAGFVDGKMTKDMQQRLYKEMVEASKRS